jgi:hypothetical protein
MRFVQFIPKLATATLAVALSILTHDASAAPRAVDGIPSALIIAKSSNRNQVHYSVRVDEACAPSGPDPVAPYWLMLEQGPDTTEPLSDREQSVLGLDRQEVIADGIRISVRALPGRTLTIRTWRGSDDRCASVVDMTVAGVPARLASVYVKQKLFGTIAYVLLTGIGSDGAVVQERVVP